SPVGEEMDLSAYRDREPACDHCGINRDRKQVYVLVNDEGRIVQVGSTCLKDFVGHGDALRAADWAEAAAELLDDESLQDRSVRLYDLAAVLRVTSAVIREEGWVSRSAASRTGKSATADLVVAVIHGKAKVEVTDEDYQLAEDAIAWAAHLQDVGNDYLANLHSLAVSEAIAFRHIALATSMISAFQR